MLLVAALVLVKPMEVILSVPLVPLVPILVPPMLIPMPIPAVALILVVITGFLRSGPG